MRHLDIATLRGILRTRDDLTLDGWSAREIERAVAAGELRRVRRGRYIARREWDDLWPESRHLAHVIATNDSAHAPPVFALTSAAAVHALALYRVRVPRVHTVYPDAPRRSEGGVVRHRGDLADSDIVEVGGILCTSVARTAYDLARLASAEVGLVCMDTALSRVGGDPRRYDEPAAEEWLEDMSERMDATGGARGIRQARMLRDIADGRSQQPLEITTKLQLRRLGFRQPGLQIPVAAPEEVMIAEKHREDWVRGTTGWRVLRGGSADAALRQRSPHASRASEFPCQIVERAC